MTKKNIALILALIAAVPFATRSALAAAGDIMQVDRALEKSYDRYDSLNLFEVFSSPASHISCWVEVPENQADFSVGTRFQIDGIYAATVSAADPKEGPYSTYMNFGVRSLSPRRELHGHCYGPGDVRVPMENIGRNFESLMDPNKIKQAPAPDSDTRSANQIFGHGYMVDSAVGENNIANDRDIRISGSSAKMPVTPGASLQGLDQKQSAGSAN